MPEPSPVPPLRKPWSASDRPVPRAIVQPLQHFLHTELAGGLLLLTAAVVALLWANSPIGETYERFWEIPLVVSVGDFEIAESLRHWVNDLLMAFFFFVVGLEIKRELRLGELQDPRAAALPLVCAIGGMAVPALLYALLNVGGDGGSGWGIPMATDIAFAIGVLSLVGRRAPANLKVFLLTLAIVDDLGAILVIAVFYTASIEFQWLLLAGGVILAIFGMKQAGVRSLVPYVVAAAVLWFAVFESGVHATIAGVVLGLLTPARPFHPPEHVAEPAGYHLDEVRSREPDGIADEGEQAALLEVARLTTEAVSPLARLVMRLHPWTSYVVLPLFALANAGVRVSGDVVSTALDQPIALGIAAGLIVGKPLGIVSAGYLMVRLGVARLPKGVGWLELTGVGALAGIGFTVAIFIAGLAFPDTLRSDAAKVAILGSSVVAAIVGSAFLALRDAARSTPTEVAEHESVATPG